MTDSTPSKLSRPVIIGLVGGVASGKTFVGGLFEKLGAYPIDADRLGHEVLSLKEVRNRLAQIWGPNILTDTGEIDRAQLGKLVFGNSFHVVAQRRQLEAIVHPRIRAMALERVAGVRALPDPPLAIIIDAPLLIEAGWETLCDLIVFVDAPLEERLRRATKRGWTESQFANREASQLPLDEKRSRSTHILDNSQPANPTQPNHAQSRLAQQVSRLWRDLEQHVARK